MCKLRQGSLLLILITVLSLSGCATNKATDPLVAKQPNDPPKTLVIETSQGSQSIEPTVVTYEPETFEDPLESINRPIFAFNDKIFRYALIPLSKGYTEYVPRPVRTGVSNFFSNLREPLNMVNHVAQGEGKKFGVCLVRFVINSTIGLFGLFDPADHWFNFKQQRSTFGDTLKYYGIGHGNYLVLPFLGQSDYRNAFSTVGESMVSPVHWISDNPETLYLQGLDGFNQFAPSAPSYEELYEQAEDPYTFFRNLYLQSVLRDEEFPEGVQRMTPQGAEKAETSNE